MSDLKSVLTQDIQRQKEAAEKALNQAKELDKKMGANSDPILKEARDTLVEIARQLAANTTSTSSAAADIIRKSRE
jgi:hypothetical protein